MSAPQFPTLVRTLSAACLLAVCLPVWCQPPAAAGDEMAGMTMPPSPPPAEPAASPSIPSGYAGIRIAPEVQQRIGVTLGQVEQGPLDLAIRTVGIVRPDETRVAHVHVKTEGWVEKLYVSYIGQAVTAGQPMFSLYSPALFAAEREYLSAVQAARSDGQANSDRQALIDAARRRLELWDVPEATIRTLDQTGVPSRTVTLASPIRGTVLEKSIVAGQYVMPANDLLLVADLSTVWVQARVFEYELPHVQTGMSATISFPSLPGRRFTGQVAFIDPVIDESSRSAQVRIELPNPQRQFRPGLFANVRMEHAMGTALTVPASAVIRSGERDVVFRAVGADRFVPVAVTINPLRFEDRYEVLGGLKAGDTVVTSANFLVDSESRLEAGSSGGMAGMPGMGGSHGNAGAAPTPATNDRKDPPMPDDPAVHHQSSARH